VTRTGVDPKAELLVVHKLRAGHARRTVGLRARRGGGDGGGNSKSERPAVL